MMEMMLMETVVQRIAEDRILKDFYKFRLLGFVEMEKLKKDRTVMMETTLIVMDAANIAIGSKGVIVEMELLNLKWDKLVTMETINFVMGAVHIAPLTVANAEMGLLKVLKNVMMAIMMIVTDATDYASFRVVATVEME